MNSYNDFTEVQLIDLLRHSDGDAFIEIFDRYYILLFSFTCRRLNDNEASKNLIHDAFVVIWEERDTIEIHGELIAFLFTLMKKQILDHYQKKKITRAYAEKFQPYLDQVLNSPNYLVRYNDLQGLIEREIAALPEEYRVAFELTRKKVK